MRSEQGTAVQATAVGQLGHPIAGSASQVFTRSRRRTSPLPVAEAPKIVVVRDLDELEQHRLALEDLAAAALESNIFYEPILLEPAVQCFGVGRQLELVLVYRSGGGPDRGPRLSGFFPFERVDRYAGVPVTALISFKHLHCFLCTPLVRRQDANETFSAALDWLTKKSGATLIELGSIGATGSVHQLLLRELHDRRRLFWLRNWSTRAFFEPGVDAESYLHDAISGLALKEVRRKARRLGERGRLAWRELEPGDEARPWLDDFLRLEASGWKGRERSALACRPAERDFFVAAATAAHARGRLMLLGLFLDDRPIALKCNFMTADGGYAFKIAFDEEYRAFSPGFLLEVENVRRLHRRAGVRWMDSCADAQHTMINRLWPGRRSMATIVFGTGRAPSDLLVSLMPLLRWGRRLVARRSPGGARVLNQDGD